jgi:hypothetical protein
LVDAGPICIAVRNFRLVRRVGPALKVTLQQDCRRDSINGTLTFFSTDVGGDQQLFRRLGGHPLVPGDDRDGQDLLQLRHKFLDCLRSRADLTVQTKRQPDHDLRHIVFPHQPINMLKVGFQGAPLIRLERLGRPSEFIAERNTDPFRSVIEG